MRASVEQIGCRINPNRILADPALGGKLATLRHREVLSKRHGQALWPQEMGAQAAHAFRELRMPGRSWPLDRRAAARNEGHTPG
jgi:hypothetical protein